MFTLTALLNAKSVAHLDTTVYAYVIRPNSTTTTINPERLRKIIDGFKYTVSYFNKLIAKAGGGINIACLERIISRRDSYIFFLLVRLLRLGAYKEAKQITMLYRNEGIYPIRHFIGKDYAGFKFRLITGIVNINPIFLLLCWIKHLLSR